MDDFSHEFEKKERIKKWDCQIGLFAKYFLMHASLPLKKFTLLDVGCGTGAALREISKIYPHAELFGCDLEHEHINISISSNQKYGKFFQAAMMDVKGFYDIIYVSNVIEHLYDWQAAVHHLLSCCRRLYILVPYKETLNLPLGINRDCTNHVVSFDNETLSFIDINQFSTKSRVIRTPYAWGHPLRREIILRAKACLKRTHFDVQREILFAVTNIKKSGDILHREPFLCKLKTSIQFAFLWN
jgi:SAM-dependent methyltransferase